MNGGPFVVSFVGPSGVGKTTIIEQLIPLLRAAGCRVGTVKHTPHGHTVVDKHGSDSARHRAAGADAVLLAGADGAVLFLTADPAEGTGDHRHHQPVEQQRRNRLAELVDTHLADVDVVLAEGYAPIHDALIAVSRTDVPPKTTPAGPPPWFTISDTAAGSDLRADQLAAIADRILVRATTARTGTKSSAEEPPFRRG